MDYDRARSNMVENQLRPNRIDDPRLLEAMRGVPRERFVPKALQCVACTDEDLRLPGGRHLIEPLALARLIQAAAPQTDDVVLVLGCSTGYCGAVMAKLAATVILVQPDEASAAAVEPLLDQLGIDNVVVTVHQDLLAGHASQAPFDVVLLAGAVDVVPKELLAQLGDGGRLVAVVEDGRIGKGKLFTRMYEVIGERVLFDARIPRLAGAERSSTFAF